MSEKMPGGRILEKVRSSSSGIGLDYVETRMQ